MRSKTSASTQLQEQEKWHLQKNARQSLQAIAQPEAGVEETVDLLISNKRSAALIQPILHKLTNKQQLIIQALYYDGKSYKETAEQVGTSVNNIKSVWHNAKVAIQKELAKQGITEE